MAVTYGFYNALNHDRLYDAIQMSSIFDGIIRDGIFSTIGDTMIVTAPEDGLYVNVGSGRAWFNHTWTLNDTDYPIEAEQAEVVLDRIDAVILEVNSSTEVRANSIKFLKGTPSSNPVKPNLTHNAEVNQYALAYVRIRAGQTTIFQSDIENAVGTDETPFTTGVLQQVSIETLLKQWEAEFNTYFTNFKNTSTTEFNNWFATKVSEYTAWFAQMQTNMDSNFNEFDAWFQNIKDQLDQDQAGHLQLQIDALNSDINALEAEMPFAGGSKVNINFEYNVVPNIQYSNEHYKLTVGDTVRENNFSSSELHFNEYGILTVGDGVLEVTYDVTDSRTGKITHVSYTYTINMPYFGRFAYNVTISADLYNYQGWLESIGKDPSQYSTIEDVFADEKLLRELMTRHASVDYLVDWLANNNEDAHTVLNNDYCAKWINLRDYALDKLYANPTVKAVMDEVDKYGYGEWALVGQVPKMTSNTAPSGKVIFSNNLINNSQAYWAFDGNETDSSRWHASKQDGTYIGYEFDEPKNIHAFRINADHSTTLGAYIKTFVIKGRNADSESWVDLTDIITANDSKTSNVVTVGKMNNNGVAYKQIAVFPLSSYADEYRLYEVQFYAWQPKGAVPVMTSNTAPYGTVTGSTQGDKNNYGNAFLPFNGLGPSEETSCYSKGANSSIVYKFVNPIKAKMFEIASFIDFQTSAPSAISILGSNDGTNYTQLFVNNSHSGALNTKVMYLLDNDNYYLYYKIYAEKGTLPYFSINYLQFYGRSLNVSVPTMTSNTAPWGEASASSELSTSVQAYKAFNGGTSDYWECSSHSVNDYLGYDFKKPVLVKTFSTKSRKGYSDRCWKKGYLQGSEDNVNWVNISDEFSISDDSIHTHIVNNNTAYRYYRIIDTSTKAITSIGTTNFYGLDYSEREFEEGSTMKYLYDHGVEMEPIVVTQNNSTAEKQSDCIYLKKSGTSPSASAKTTNTIDLTSYKLARIIAGLKNSKSGSEYGQFATYNGDTRLSYANIIDNLMPSGYMDISSVSQSANVGMYLNATNGSVTYEYSLTEMWLE